MFGIGGKIVKWHYEIIDGRRIRVIDRFSITEVSLIPERRPTPDAADVLTAWGNLGKCSICGLAYDVCECIARR